MHDVLHMYVCVCVFNRGAESIYGPIYGSDIYATVGRPRRPYWPASGPSPAVYSMSPTDSRLSTNV